MEIASYSFQCDSKIVLNNRSQNENYLIDYSKEVIGDYCVIYFSSNDIYYPNSETSFIESIQKKNKFEWFNNRIPIASKHIFLRDIYKQWYINGINTKINTPELLYNFLKKETEGYKIITLGSSAGGFAAVIYGQLLGALKILTFNGQFELNSLLVKSNQTKDPLIFRNQNNDEIRKWYDSKNFIKDPSTIFYFQSINSPWDIEQGNFIKDVMLNRIIFKSNNHGLPFYRFNISIILNLNQQELIQLTKLTINPFGFSVRHIGFYKTIKSLINLSIAYILKITKRKMQLWNK